MNNKNFQKKIVRYYLFLLAKLRSSYKKLNLDKTNQDSSNTNVDSLKDISSTSSSLINTQIQSAKNSINGVNFT